MRVLTEDVKKRLFSLDPDEGDLSADNLNQEIGNPRTPRDEAPAEFNDLKEAAKLLSTAGNLSEQRI